MRGFGARVVLYPGPIVGPVEAVAVESKFIFAVLGTATPDCRSVSAIVSCVGMSDARLWR